jgi:hypothetical protein
MPKEYDTTETIEVDDNDRPINEGDRPIVTEDMFEDGICFFPGPEAEMPSEVRIATPVNFLKFIKAAIVLDNDSDDGFKQVKWTYPEKPPEDVLGLVLNMKAVAKVQEIYNGKGFLLKEPNGSGWTTLGEWNSRYNTDGLSVLARMRWHWYTKGGGVTTGSAKFRPLGGTHV